MEKRERRYIPIAVKRPEVKRPEGRVLDPQLNQQIQAQLQNARAKIWEFREGLRTNFIEPLLARRLERFNMLLSSLNLQTPHREAEKEAETRKCPSCGAEVPKTAKYCPECGASLEARRVNPRLAGVTL